jgi:hypothetical protein
MESQAAEPSLARLDNSTDQNGIKFIAKCRIYINSLSYGWNITQTIWPIINKIHTCWRKDHKLQNDVPKEKIHYELIVGLIEHQRRER